MEHNNAKESPPDAQRFGPTRDSILAPAGDSGKLDLAEVIDVPAIQSLMDDFHRLTHIPVSLVDLKDNVLIGVGWQEICLHFHRTHSVTLQHCLESDLQLAADVPPGEFKLYKCKNGMWDIATPLMVGGQHVGNLFSGQFFFDDEPLDVELFLAQAREYGFNEQEYLAALEAVPRLSRETVNCGMAFLLKLAGMISQLGFGNFKLARSLAERNALFENMLEGFSYCRMLYEEGKPQDFIYLDVNGAFERLTGLRDVVGKKVSEVIPGIRESNPALFEIYGRVALTGKPEKFEMFLDTLGIWFSIAVYSPQKDCFIAVFDNINERKRAEVALRESEERYRVLIDNAAEAIAVAQGGMFKFVNPAAEVMIGYSREELTSRPFLEFVHPEDRARVTANHQLRQKGEPAVEGDEARIVRKDGAVRWLQIKATRIDWQGAPAMLNFYTDITERKQAEAALRLTQFSVDHAADGLFWMNPDARIISVNEAACRELGYTRAELLQLSIPEIDPDYSPEMWRSVWVELKARGSMSFETRHRTQDGQIIPVEITANYLKFASQEFICAFVRDISERKRAETERQHLEAQLHQLHKMEAIGRLAGGVAHDFNNLLTVILGYSDILLAKFGPDSPNRDCILDIKGAGERAAALTRQLLAFSRKQILAPKVLSLNEVVSDIEKMIRRLIGEDITLSTILSPSVSKVKSDPGQIEQVILNLAVNARDAMPHGGRLTIETRACVLDEAYCRLYPESRPGRYTMLCLTDTGCGMSPEVKARLFEPFFTTKGPGQGTGLGLATVFGVVKQSGGAIEVYSEEGVGTCFKIYLPATPEDDPATQTGKGEGAVPRGSETILLVEDEEGVRRIARRTLEGQGYRILEAGSGPQAIKLAESATIPIHLLLTDIVMPEMSGRQLAEILLPRRKGLKVLFMSGYTDDAIVRHGIIEANVAFLQKPFLLRELACKVREVLDGKA